MAQNRKPSAALIGWACLFLLLAAVPVAAQSSEYTLADLTVLAERTHPTLQAARSEASAARGAWLASRRWTNPELAWERGTGDPEDGSASRRLGGLTLTQYFENPLHRHHRLKALEAEAEAAGAAAVMTALDVAYEVTQHFFAIRRLEAQVEIARRTAESLEQTRRVTAARAEVGEAPELESIRLRVEALRARNAFSALQAELAMERRRLDAFMNGELPQDYRLAGDHPFLPISRGEEELLERMLVAHPALQGAQAQRQAADSRLAASRAARIPDPALSAFQADEMDGRVRGLELSLSVPLWDFQGREVRTRRDLLTASEHALSAVRLELRMELALSYTEVRVAEQSLLLFAEELLSAADRSLQIAEASYRAGEIPLLEYLDAQRTYQSVLDEYEATRYRWHLSRAALERAVGGEIE